MTVSRGDARKLYDRLKAEAEAAGYNLNADVEFTLDLMEGLLVNEGRFGYWACPCRDAAGVRAEDLDIICPCDYRDPDLEDFGACFCALYVSDEILRGEKKAGPIPERRGEEPKAAAATGGKKVFGESDVPVWRCTVCGYLCARPQPPLKCPICKVDKDRFEQFG